MVFFPLQQKECFTRTWAPITYVKTNSLIFPLGATPHPPISSSTKRSRGHATAGLFFLAASNKYWSCDSTLPPLPPIFTTKRQCWYKTGHWDLPRTSLVKPHNLPISTAAQEPPPLPENLHSNPYVVNSLKPY